jgi:hypothetical protein
MCKIVFLVQAINTDEFYKSFWPIMGKSLMFIVKKTRHEPNLLNPSLELIRVSSSGAVLKYLNEKGVHIVTSKVVCLLISVYLFDYLVDCLFVCLSIVLCCDVIGC